jgi:peptidylprolyl isomerase
MQRRTLLASTIAATGIIMSDTNDAAAQGTANENTLYFDLKDGRVTIQLLPELAPKQGFYDGTPFHRVIEGFMAQGGDPTGTGTGGSPMPDLVAEFSPPAKAKFIRGTCGMARTASPNTANSQFFIMFAPAPSLDGQYTIWGRVTAGMDVVDKIKRGQGGSGSVPAPADKLIKATLAA